MAKIKLTLDTRSNSQTTDGKYPLVLRISHKSKTRDIGFDIHVFQEQIVLDPLKISGITNAVRHTKRIDKTYKEIDLWLDENKAEIKLWTIAQLKDTIERKFFNKQPELSLLDHAAKQLYRLTVEKRFSTASSYEDAVKVVVKFQMKKAGKNDQQRIKTLFNKNAQDCFTVLDEFKLFDIPIKAISTEYAKDFKAYLAQRGASKNTVGITLRSLQTILNDAATSHDDLKDHSPLEGIKKSSSSNPTIVLSQEEIAKIRNAQYETGTAKFHVRNYFLFMFNNMGMNFFDLVLLKRHQYDGERVSYTRKKTANSDPDYFSIKQTDENKHIIAHYGWGKKKDEYIFPLIPNDTPESRLFSIKNYRAKWFNKHMKAICNELQIDKHVTTYTARDTWTNLGLEMGIDIRQISSGLGHSSVKTTEKHYSSSIQARLLDEINGQIITPN